MSLEMPKTPATLPPGPWRGIFVVEIHRALPSRPTNFSSCSRRGFTVEHSLDRVHAGGEEEFMIHARTKVASLESGQGASFSRHPDPEVEVTHPRGLEAEANVSVAQEFGHDGGVVDLVVVDQHPV